MEWSIPVTLVKQYVYCPVIPWIMHKIGVVEPPTPSMERGREEAVADVKERVAEILGLPRPWRIEKPLYSRRLGLRGVVDLVAGNKPYKVVEVKIFNRKAKWSRHFKSQLMIYALLVNDVMGPVDEAILVLGEKIYRYIVTHEMLLEAKRYVEKTREVLEKEEPPQTTATPGMCRYCWHHRLCPYQ